MKYLSWVDCVWIIAMLALWMAVIFTSLRQGGAGMSKTAARRHQHNRHMRRRLRTPVWSWVERTDPAYLSDDDRAALRNRAERHSVPCSCYWCRSYRIEVSKFKQRKAMETAA